MEISGLIDLSFGGSITVKTYQDIQSKKSNESQVKKVGIVCCCVVVFVVFERVYRLQLYVLSMIATILH